MFLILYQLDPLLLPGNCEFCTNPCDFLCSVLDTIGKKKFLSSSFIQGETLFDYGARTVDMFQQCWLLN